MYQHAKNKGSTSRLSKVRAPTRQTDTIERITMPHLWVVDMKLNGPSVYHATHSNDITFHIYQCIGCKEQSQCWCQLNLNERDAAYLPFDVIITEAFNKLWIAFSTNISFICPNCIFTFSPQCMCCLDCFGRVFLLFFHVPSAKS